MISPHPNKLPPFGIFVHFRTPRIHSSYANSFFSMLKFLQHLSLLPHSPWLYYPTRPWTLLWRNRARAPLALLAPRAPQAARAARALRERLSWTNQEMSEHSWSTIGPRVNTANLSTSIILNRPCNDPCWGSNHLTHSQMKEGSEGFAAKFAGFTNNRSMTNKNVIGLKEHLYINHGFHLFSPVFTCFHQLLEGFGGSLRKCKKMTCVNDDWFTIFWVSTFKQVIIFVFARNLTQITWDLTPRRVSNEFPSSNHFGKQIVHNSRMNKATFPFFSVRFPSLVLWMRH